MSNQKNEGNPYEVAPASELLSENDLNNVAGGFLTFKFDTVFTTKIDWSGPGDEGPEE
jgi:hypothetical protein